MQIREDMVDIPQTNIKPQVDLASSLQGPSDAGNPAALLRPEHLVPKLKPHNLTWVPKPTY